jgi:hypothetical protein
LALQGLDAGTGTGDRRRPENGAEQVQKEESDGPIAPHAEGQGNRRPETIEKPQPRHRQPLKPLQEG